MACLVSPDGAVFWAPYWLPGGGFCGDGWFGKSSTYCGGVAEPTAEALAKCFAMSVQETFDAASGCPACPGAAQACP
jgi:hypothetical protein